MKKLGLIVSLLVLFSFLPGVIGCGAPTPPTPTSTTPTVQPTQTAPTPTTEVKPIKLKYADSRAHKPGYFGTMPEMWPWMKAVEGATNGRIVIDAYPSGSLVTSLAVAETSISQGVADIGYGNRATAGTLPMVDVMTGPALYGDTSATENTMIYEFFLWEQLKDDWAAMNLIDLGPGCLHASLLITAKKPVRTFADVKGLTLNSINKYDVMMFSDIGAVVLPISNIDAYDAMAKGMIDGGIWNWEGPFIFGWIDNFKPGYYIDCGGLRRSLWPNAMMNLQKYNTIPADLRPTLDYMIWRWASVYFGQRIDAQVPMFQKGAADRGIQYIVWADADKQKFVDAKKKVMDAWIAEMEKLYKRGAEASELFKMYSDAAAKYKPPAAVPMEPKVTGGTEAEWNKVFGPGSTWGAGYKAYSNQTSIHKLEGNEFKP
ncbi:MAG: hypothetical protein V1767_08045 [Chloroflexota bacterium]